MNNDELNALYRKSCDMVMPYLKLEGAKQLDANTEEASETLKQGLRGLQTIVCENPNNWSAYWMIGKIYQVRGNHEEAYQSFLKSHRGVLTQQDVMRELGLECLHTKRFSQAVHYCHAAIEFAPDDYSLWPNMATSQLFNQNLVEAEKWAKKSLEKIPDDEPAKNVMKMVEEIKDGKREFPTDFAALEQQ